MEFDQIQNGRKRREEHQANLLKYKKTIEKFLANKSVSPKSVGFNSTLFRAIDQSSPPPIQYNSNVSNQMNSQVEAQSIGNNSSIPVINNEKEMQILNSIDEFLNKNKTGTMKTQLVAKKVTELSNSLKLNDFQILNSSSPKTIYNQKQGNQPKLKKNTSERTSQKKSEEEFKQTLNWKATKQAQNQPPLPPKQVDKKKQEFRSTLLKYRQLQQQLPQQILPNEQNEQNTLLFDLSQSQLKSQMREQPIVHRNPQQILKSDPVLLGLYEERAQLQQKLQQVEAQLHQLQSQ